MWVEALKGEAQGEAAEGVVLMRGLGLSVPEVSGAGAVQILEAQRKRIDRQRWGEVKTNSVSVWVTQV